MTTTPRPLEQLAGRPAEFSDPNLSNVEFNNNSISKQLIAPIDGIDNGTVISTTIPPIQSSPIYIDKLLRPNNINLSNALESLINSSGIIDFTIFNPYIHYYQKVLAPAIGQNNLVTIQPSANIKLSENRFNIYSRSYRTY